MIKNKIPNFKNLEEEANFWDTHDATDFLTDMKLTDVKFAPRQKKEDTITIRVEPRVKKSLETLSTTYGVNISTLSRMWIMEKLLQQKGTFAS
ncbi:MAG: CopG family antitoxin [Candidatus Woesebacteria bacterium]|nr:CopG family antitoxin [Candidatus Woesebacteria bacterium]